MSDETDNARVERILERAKTDLATRDVAAFMVARMWIALIELTAIVFKRVREANTVPVEK